MNRTTVSVMTLTATAGLACTALAGGDRTMNLVQNVTPNVIEVPSSALIYNRDGFRVVEPTQMFVDGQSVPFRTFDRLEDANITDGNSRLLSDKWTADGTNPFVSPYLLIVGNPAATPPIVANPFFDNNCAALLDDLQFAGATTRRFMGAKFDFVVSPAGDSQTIRVFFFGFNAFNPSGIAPTPPAVITAVNGSVVSDGAGGFTIDSNTAALSNLNAASFIGFQFIPPTDPITFVPSWGVASTTFGGLFTTRYVTSGFVVSEMLSGPSANFSFEMNVLNQSGGGVASNAVFPLFSTRPDGVAGTTSNPFLYANDNDTNTGIYPTGPAGGGSPRSGPFQISLNGTPVRTGLSVAFAVNDDPAPATVGACTFTRAVGPNGCVLLSSATCAAQGGTYRGNGTVCNPTFLGSGLLVDNGPLATGTATYGPISPSSPALPAGAEWAEGVISPPGTPSDPLSTCASIQFGTRCDLIGVYDKVTVPAGQTWTVNALRIYVLPVGPGAAGLTALPVDEVSIRFFNQNPVSVTPVLAASAEQVALTAANVVPTNMYAVPSVTAPGFFTTPPTLNLNNRLYQVDVNVAPKVLAAGDYYFGWSFRRLASAVSGASTVAIISPYVTVMRNPSAAAGTFENGRADGLIFQPNPTGNGIYTGAGFWYTDYADAASGGGAAASTCLPFTAEYAYQLRGTFTAPAGCYPDCDGSGGLSPADFTCFLGKFRAGTLPYADCDLSGGLSPADFTCFLGKFRAGCP